MKSSAKNIVLKSVDDIFQTEENRADAQRDRVQEIPLDQLKPFKNHPFKVRDDQRMLNAVTRLEDGRCFLFSADDDFMQSYVSKQRFMAVL